MALIHADRVKETSTTTGTGTYDLAGATTGFQGFVAAIGDTNTCYYTAENGTDWEVGIGTVGDASPDTLARTTILASSNAGSAVSWGAGTKNVFVGYPAGKSVILDGNDDLVVQDDGFLVVDPADNTKQVRIDAGSITTATTRTITMPDQDIDLTPDSGDYRSSTRIAFFAHKNGTNQTGITSSTKTLITFSNEGFDIGGHFSTSTSRWTPPAGIVHIQGRARQIANSVDQQAIILVIRKNGTDIVEQVDYLSAAGSGISNSVFVSILDQANGTDYYELWFQGNGTGDKTVSGDDDDTHFFGWML